jgi:hypothetical protein
MASSKKPARPSARAPDRASRLDRLGRQLDRRVEQFGGARAELGRDRQAEPAPHLGLALRIARRLGQRPPQERLGALRRTPAPGLLGRLQQRGHDRGVAGRLAAQQVQRDRLGIGSFRGQHRRRPGVPLGPLPRRQPLIEGGGHERVRLTRQSRRPQPVGQARGGARPGQPGQRGRVP